MSFFWSDLVEMDHDRPYREDRSEPTQNAHCGERDRRQARSLHLHLRSDATEVRAAAAHLGLDLGSGEAEALLREYDTDKSGAIDLAELAAIVANLEELKAHQGSLEA